MPSARCSIQPGPLLATEHPYVFWGLIASLYLGNIVLLVLNLPLVGLFTNLLRMPRDVLLTLIVLISAVGVFTVNNSVLDLFVMVAMGVLGYVLRKFGLNPATIILPFAIGTVMEQSLVQTLLLARGRPGYLLERPIAFTPVLTGAVGFAWPCLRRLRFAH